MDIVLLSPPPISRMDMPLHGGCEKPKTNDLLVYYGSGDYCGCIREFSPSRLAREAACLRGRSKRKDGTM